MAGVIVDADLDKDGNVIARHVMDITVGPHNHVQHPHDPTKTIAHHEFLGLCNTDAALRTQAGYDVVSQLPGEQAPKSRWQRIVEACNHPNAPGHLKILGLR